MSTTSPRPGPQGVQEPRIDVQPRGKPGHRETVKLCSDTGLDLDKWQRILLEAWLAESGDGYAAMECAGVVARQNGKGGALEAVGLASLFVDRVPLTIWTAHLFKTAHEAFLRLRALIQADPLLDAKVDNYYRSGARLAIVLKSGPRIEFVSRSDGAGRGLSAPRVILDEAMYLTFATMGALFPTMAAQRDPQLIYTASAGFDHSAVLHRLRRRALTGGDERLAYLEWSVDPQDFDPDSVDDWAKANPALGIRISEPYIRAERNALSLDEFKRERLGIFDPEADDKGDLALDPDAWAASFDGRSTADGKVSFGLDVGLKGFSSIGVAGSRADGLLHVEVVEHRETGGWVVGRCAELCSRWDASLLIDPSAGAGSYLPDLIAAGVPVVTLNRREVASACGRLAHHVADGKVRHRGAGELNAAVATAVVRKLGESFVWDAASKASPDLSPLYAVTLAAWPEDGEKPKSTLSF